MELIKSESNEGLADDFMSPRGGLKTMKADLRVET
jgi:hypothetical protein